MRRFQISVRKLRIENTLVMRLLIVSAGNFSSEESMPLIKK